MIYQHPLAYLLGVEGVALLRGWAGDYDKDFVVAHLAEVRQLLANDSLVNHPGVMVDRSDTRTGYRQWSTTYGDGRNGLFDYSGSVPIARGPDGEPGLVAAYPHTAGDYIRAALPVGLQVRRCDEPRHVPRTPASPATPDAQVDSWDNWPWSLMGMVSEATRAAFSGAGGTPQTIICHFQLADT